MRGSSASAIELKRLVPCALLLLCSVPCLLRAQQETFTLEGRFTSTRGEPIAGAVITTASRVSAPSDAAGHFSMILPRGVTHLSAQADQYSTFRTDLDIEGDQTLDIQLRGMKP